MHYNTLASLLPTLPLAENWAKEVVQTAAEHVLEHHYKHQYPQPEVGSSSAFWVQLGWPHNRPSPPEQPTAVDQIPRPNHGLANAVRKALLVPIVLKAYSEHDRERSPSKVLPCGWDLLEPAVSALQTAMLFSAARRESEVGFSDSSKAYYQYRANSRAAFDAYAQSKYFDHHFSPLNGSTVRELCLTALEFMGQPASCPPSAEPIKKILEASHVTLLGFKSAYAWSAPAYACRWKRAHTFSSGCSRPH